MAGQREDYLLRLIEDLREFVTRAVALRHSDQLGQALLTVVAAQERLFARPMVEFAARPIDDQLRLLTLDESAETARGKCLAYASILQEAARVYRARGREDLAASADQLALYVLLTVALGDAAQAAELRGSIVELRARLPDDLLQAPVRELLARLPG
jgi:hypothetical protein